MSSSVKTTVIFLFFLIVSVSLCHAQLKGGVSVYGFDVNYHTSTLKYDNGNSYKVYDFSLIPSFGVFLNEHWLVGLKTEWNRSKDGSLSSADYYVSDVSSKGFSFGPFVRYYAMLGERVAFFAQGEITWGKGSLSYKITDPQNGYEFDLEDELKTSQMGLRPGIVFFVTKRIALESTIGFIGYSKVKADNNFDGFGLDFNQKDFEFSFSPSTLNLGFRYYLTKGE